MRTPSRREVAFMLAGLMLGLLYTILLRLVLP